MSQFVVRASFKKSVSDDHYGSEGAEISIELTFDDQKEDVSDSDMARELLQNARALVHAELSRSPSSAVRRAVVPPQPVKVTAGLPADDDDLPFESDEGSQPWR